MKAHLLKILQSLLDLLASKKVLTAIGAVVATSYCASAGCDPERVKEIMALFAALILSQGAADFGKHANPLPPPPSATDVGP